MLESIRSHRRWLMFFLMLIVFPSFVVTGIYGWNQFTSASDAVARVGEVDISAQQLEAAHRQRVETLRARFGDNLDPRLFDSPAARAASLQELLAQQALRREVAASHVNVSDARVRDVIAAIPAFQKDGKFSYDQAKVLLAAQGMNEQMFEARIRDDLTRQTLLSAIAESAIVPTTVSTRVGELLEETRTVREMRFQPSDFLAQAKVGDDDVKAFYENNRSLFETPEAVKAQYVVLTLDAVAKTIAAPDAELRSYYEQNKASLGGAEKRRASHILFTVGEGGSAKDKEGARKLAAEVLAQARAKPESFAELARKYSKDPGSASSGGELGFDMTRSAGTGNKPFDDTVFSLAQGQISDVVESEAGFHVIKVTKVEPASIPSFDAVKDQIAASYRRQQAQKKFAELAEQFTNLTYEQSDSLKPVADKLDLSIQTAEAVTRNGLPADAAAAKLFSPAVVQALFSDDALQKKRNIAAVEAAPNTLISARVVEHQPAKLRPLEEVSASIRDRLRRQEASKLAREAAQKAAAEQAFKPAETKFGPPKTVSRGNPADLPPAAVKAVMQVPKDKLPNVIATEAANGAHAAVWIVEAKLPEAANAEQRRQIREGLGAQAGMADDVAYLEALKKKHRAEILSTELAQAAAQRNAAVEAKAAQ